MGEGWRSRGEGTMQSPQEDTHDLLMWQGFVARLARLRDAAANLSRPATFDVTVAVSGDPDVAAVAVHGKADTGERRLVIHNLSQAHKLITGSFAAGAGGLDIAGAFLVNGCRIGISPSDSLNDIAVKFTRSAANVRAQTVHLGPNDFRLIVTANQTGAEGAIQVSPLIDGEAAGDALDRLGLSASAAQLVAPRDARFSIDDVDMTAPDNTIVDAVPGVTLTLLGAPTKNKPATCTIDIRLDTTAALDAVGEFVDAFNHASGSEWASSDRTAKVIASIAETVSSGSGCVNMADSGLTMTKDGSLALDTVALRTMLETDADRVYRVFAMCVDSDCPDLAFVSASAKTLESGIDGFLVSITSPASVSTVTADIAQTEASVDIEHLTFTGPLFPSTVKLTLPAGSGAVDTCTRINRSARLRGRVSADVQASTNRLILTSRYGAAGVFSVVSDQPAAANNSGIGQSPATVAGVDVDGTIAGEPADGEGRTLMGRAGNPRTEALQILVTAANVGDCGRVYVHRGLADRIYHMIHQVLESGQSATGRTVDISAQIGDTEQQIARMNDQLGAFGEYLTQTLTAMDLRVSHLREQADAITRRTTRRPASRAF